MKIKTELMHLTYKHPFNIARRKADQKGGITNVKISIEHDGVLGLGEAHPSPYYYGETIERIIDVAKKAESILATDPFLLEDIIDELYRAFPNAPSAIAGIDIALYDLVGKLLGIPLYKYFGLNPDSTPTTDFTIGIDTIPVMLKKLKEASGYPIYKVKVGVEGDMDMLKAIRDNTDAVIRVDANTGWDVDEAIEKINEMEKYDIELVEQPIPAKNYEGLKKIRQNVNIPIMADEDSVTSEDIPTLAGCVDMINIKLMKCRGLRDALRMIHIGHSFGMKVMLGCMGESSLSLTAAAHLSPLVEYADLDNNLLIIDDPFEGLKQPNGRILLPNRPGIGVIEK